MYSTNDIKFKTSHTQSKIWFVSTLLDPTEFVVSDIQIWLRSQGIHIQAGCDMNNPHKLLYQWHVNGWRIRRNGEPEFPPISEVLLRKKKLDWYFNPETNRIQYVFNSAAKAKSLSIECQKKPKNQKLVKQKKPKSKKKTTKKGKAKTTSRRINKECP